MPQNLKILLLNFTISAKISVSHSQYFCQDIKKSQLFSEFLHLQSLLRQTNILANLCLSHYITAFENLGSCLSCGLFTTICHSYVLLWQKYYKGCCLAVVSLIQCNLFCSGIVRQICLSGASAMVAACKNSQCQTQNYEGTAFLFMQYSFNFSESKEY